MVGEIISAVKLIFEAIKDKKGNSRKDRETMFTSFIQPVYDQLELAHRKYLDDFQQYREFINHFSDSFDLKHPIFEMMQKDHALSDADRAKIVAMAEYLNTGKNKDLSEKISKLPAGRLAQVVLDYITTPSYQLTQRWGLNAPRRSLLMQMESCAQSTLTVPEKKTWAIHIIDEAVKKLQDRYMDITETYMELKGKLIIG